VNVHGGQGGPALGDYPATMMMRFLEFGWYSQRPLVRLVFSGALERHPRLRLVFTEAGNGWVPSALGELDRYYDQVLDAPAGSVEAHFGDFTRANVPRRPSEYWARQCHLGASSMSPGDWPSARVAGVDHVMWGSDYPHLEGTYPFTAESLRFTFAGIDTTSGSCSARTPHVCTASISTRSRRSPPRSAPGWTTWPRRSRRPRSPPTQ